MCRTGWRISESVIGGDVSAVCSTVDAMIASEFTGVHAHKATLAYMGHVIVIVAVV